MGLDWSIICLLLSERYYCPGFTGEFRRLILSVSGGEYSLGFTRGYLVSILVFMGLISVHNWCWSESSGKLISLSVLMLTSFSVLMLFSVQIFLISLCRFKCYVLTWCFFCCHNIIVYCPDLSSCEPGHCSNLLQWNLVYISISGWGRKNWIHLSPSVLTVNLYNN